MEYETHVGGLIGVLIYTGDLKRLANFYENTLGMTPQSVKSHAVAFKWSNNTRITLATHSEVHGRSREPQRMMVNLATDDILAAHAALAAKGVAFIRKPEQEKWGGWVATFSDPDGNILQLLQLPPE